MGRTKEAMVLMDERGQMSIQSEWEVMLEQATMLVQSGFLPKAINSPAKAVAVIMKGRELGIPMMLALSHIHIIDGKPCMSAELMLALIMERGGVTLEFLQNDDSGCKIRVPDRPSLKGSVVQFTMEDAVAAQLLGKDNWRKYPRAMCRSRCIMEMARKHFPDVINGVSYAPEELAGDRVVMNSDGAVLEVLPVDKTVDKVKPAAPNRPDAKVLEFKTKMEKLMPDTPEAWGWLEKRMGGLSDDWRMTIRIGAVGRRVCDLLSDIEAAQFDATPDFDASAEIRA